MGRAPCCDKASVKKGPWSPEEDAMLKDYIEKHGIGGNWIALPQKAGLRRCGKSCRLRWLNYLRPNIKHGDFTDFEDRVICTLYSSIGSRWSVIAAQLPGRTDNDIKNYWNTKLKKKLMASEASSFFFSQVPDLINSHTYHIPPPLPPSLLSHSFPLPPALQSPSAHEINFKSPLQHYQVKRDGSSIAYGGGGAGAGSQAACSLSEANYNVVSETGTVSGTNSDQSPSCDYYPYQGVEEKENLAHTSSGGGSGWTRKAFACKTWEENAILADYGFEEIKQLISSDNSSCSLLFDENKEGESVYY